MALTNELSGDIASAILAANQNGRTRRELLDIVLSVHSILQHLNIRDAQERQLKHKKRLGQSRLPLGQHVGPTQP